MVKILNFQLRFLIPLIITLVAAAYIAVPLMDRLNLRWFARDLDTRGEVVTNALADSIVKALEEDEGRRLLALLERAVQDERLYAIGLCSLDGKLVRRTGGYPAGLSCSQAEADAGQPEPRRALAGGAVHVGVHVVSGPDGPVAKLVLLHDLSFIDRRSLDTRRYLIGFIAALGLAIALITVIVAQLSWRGWVTGVRGLLRGDGLLRPLTTAAPPPEITPLADELRSRLRDLEDEYRRALGPQAPWDPGRLRALLRTQLRGDQVIVVSNREPYIHETSTGGVVVKRPASGLVTAVEPVMRACSGTWVAHGSGSADRQVTDRHDRVGVPPGGDEYVLRRIWLTAEEEQGYYYGFANEGVWPLCHVAHVQPVFRASDWEYYREVNQRFADAVVGEARGEDPIVLAQDYHFALLPAMIRAKLPRATIITFWHIPWPNPESFGICPWRREILEGMLGSTILGFHTRFHCKNFIETVDRYLEARIEHENSTISLKGEETLVENYPISIEWPSEQERASWPPVEECRRRVFERFSLAADSCLAVGVDRFDYTKAHPGAAARRRAPPREAPGMDRPLRVPADRRTNARAARGIPAVPRTHRPLRAEPERALRPGELPARAPACPSP